MLAGLQSRPLQKSFEPWITEAKLFRAGSTTAIRRSVQDKLREPWVSVADFGADKTGAADATTPINNAKSLQGTTRLLFAPQGTYSYNGSTYTVDGDWLFINKGYTGGVNVMALAENQALSLTFQTSTAAVLDSKLSRIGIGVTGAAYGAQHADCFRGNLYNSSTDGNGNTVIYAHAQSMGSTNWTASLHGEFRHGGGTSSGLNIEASSHSADGSFYGAVISNTSASLNAAGTKNNLTGALPVSHASATGLLITGTNNTNAMGGWVTGLSFHQNSMRADGTCITFNPTAAVSSVISSSASVACSVADIFLQGDSANGIILAGTYTDLALRVNAGQYIGMEATGVIKFSYSAPSVSFYNGANDRVALDLSATPGLRVDTTKVVGTRKTGWATATGTATRGTFDTAAVTLPQLAERVKALIDDLHSSSGHGLIGL